MVNTSEKDTLVLFLDYLLREQLDGHVGR